MPETVWTDEEYSIKESGKEEPRYTVVDNLTNNPLSSPLGSIQQALAHISNLKSSSAPIRVPQPERPPELPGQIGIEEEITLRSPELPEPYLECPLEE